MLLNKIYKKINTPLEYIKISNINKVNNIVNDLINTPINKIQVFILLLFNR